MVTAGSAKGSVPALGNVSQLQQWMARQYAVSAAALVSAISATHLVKERRGFGQTIRPLPGSVLASTALGSWDPDPDYFFHWLRDSAIVIDALRHVITDQGGEGEGLCRFKQFVAFSLSLNRLDGGAFLQASGDFRKNVDPWFLQFVRDDSDLRAIAGDRVLGEPRFNPDATLDISKWSRPQHDGPALRALVLMRFWSLDTLDAPTRASMQTLIETDIAFILDHWHEPCFDIWEEEQGHHYCTRLLQHAALAEGAVWMECSPRQDESFARARACRTMAREILKSLDQYWNPDRGLYVSRKGVANPSPGKDPDFATILGVIHAGRREGAHSVLDPKVLATLTQLEALFEASYVINQGRPADLGPAMGRYSGDSYFSGGAYYFSTLGAAEFYYSLAEAVAAGADLAVMPENEAFLLRLGLADSTLALLPQENRRLFFEALLQRGDQFMATVAAHTPASGELSEQFDQATGAQTSAKMLTWSHAAFITAFTRRQAALRAQALPLETRASQ
ncbi:MAG TPA: glycoside hydrolase family 15 protein [Methylocella sp.]|nr:glycoside hydrolase family 15 protein [Methylocella sp.]